MQAGTIVGSMLLLGTGLQLAPQASPAAAQCPPDAVRVGHLCVDRYEASAWKIPDTLPNAANLIAAVQAGMITSALQMTGAQRRGETSDDYGPGCPDNGAGCTKVYSVSIPGVKPSAYLTWFQAAAACANAGKRLPTNQEWQVAALGTPDPGPDNGTTDCNTGFGAFTVVNTGSRGACMSNRGAFDMVGNLYEWTADWVPGGGGCLTWGTFSDDVNCFSGNSVSGGVTALVRGGSDGSGSFAGPLDVQRLQPSGSLYYVGFRCAREL